MNGVEWVVDGWGCAPESLRDLGAMSALFESMIRDLKLRPVGEMQWHKFPGSGGITGMCLLSESHLTCHTFPEHGSLCINLFCCVPRPEWKFEDALRERFGAAEVSVRRMSRSYEMPREQVASD
jgi:S-adenosylmethionine decarboxylase